GHAEQSVAGTEIDPAVDDGDAGALDRPPLGGHAVDGLVVALGVDVPDDPARGGVVGAHVAVHRPGDAAAWNARRRGRLAGVAASDVEAVRGGRGRVPAFLAVGEVESIDAAGVAGGVLGFPDVGDRHVEVLVVGGESPFDAAEYAARRESLLP